MPLYQPCPLCSTHSPVDFHADKYRRYFRCLTCSLIFADSASQLLPSAEKAIYSHHENSPDDPLYRNFLNRLVQPLTERLGKQPLHGLDFGCGPGPTLSIMLAEMGHRMSIYDPYFADDKRVLTHTYDFITCTEAIEHFYTPAKEWQLLLGLLKPGGWMGLMTSLTNDLDNFAQWHYKNDPTHVSFFSRETFEYLCKRDGLELTFIDRNVILLRKADC